MHILGMIVKTVSAGAWIKKNGLFSTHFWSDQCMFTQKYFVHELRYGETGRRFRRIIYVLFACADIWEIIRVTSDDQMHSKPKDRWWTFFHYSDGIYLWWLRKLKPTDTDSFRLRGFLRSTGDQTFIHTSNECSSLYTPLLNATVPMEGSRPLTVDKTVLHRNLYCSIWN